MLFAIADAAGRELCSRVHAAPGRIVHAGRWLIGAWPSPAGLLVDDIAGYVIEGHAEGSLPPKLETTCELRGDFALFAGTDEGLLLAPGPAGGHRPVFATSTRFGPAACTHLEPLLKCLESPPPLDLDFLAGELTLEPSLSPTATPYVGIERVPQMEAWLMNGTARHRQQVLRPLRDPQLRASAPELARKLRDALENAVRRAARGARRLAVATSGGLDSSSVLSVAHNLANRGDLGSEPLACNFDFDDEPSHDDRPYFRSLAEHLGVEIERVRPLAAGATMCDHFVVDAWPSGGLMSSIYCALARVARQHGADVLVTGDGGDTVLDGYPRLLGDLACRGDVMSAVRTAIRLRGPHGNGAARTVRECLLRPIVARALPLSVRRLRNRRRLPHAYPWAGPRLRQHLRLVADLPQRNRPSLEWSPAEWYQMLVSMPFFESLTMARAHEEIVVGHTRREPYLDDEFLRFAATLPPLSLLHGDFHRGLLRQAMRDLLPEDVRLRVSKGFLVPALVEMVDAAGGLGALAHLTDVRALANLGLVEPRVFQHHLDDLVRRPFEAPWRPLWAVLSTEAFLRWHAREPQIAEAA